jgi:hypothetical protein
MLACPPESFTKIARGLVNPSVTSERCSTSIAPVGQFPGHLGVFGAAARVLKLRREAGMSCRGCSNYFLTTVD